MGKGVNAFFEPKKLDPEVVEVLRKLDELLERLPFDDLKEFAESEDFNKYSKVLRRYGVK